jgi:hypothetical protein
MCLMISKKGFDEQLEEMSIYYTKQTAQNESRHSVNCFVNRRRVLEKTEAITARFRSRGALGEPESRNNIVLSTLNEQIS